MMVTVTVQKRKKNHGDSLKKMSGFQGDGEGRSE